jgi:ribose transport system substrate-binding protein
MYRFCSSIVMPYSRSLHVGIVLVLVGLMACTGAALAKGKSRNALLHSLPPQLRAIYTHTTDPILPSAYDQFKPVKAPWKICFADSYEGNAWRLQVRKGLETLTALFHKVGKTSGLSVAVSNGNVALQISQIRAFIDKGCSVILSIPESATGINAAVRAAYKAGIPFISFAGAVTSPYAINVDSNYYLWGYDMAVGIAKVLHGHGNVVMVKGIEGQPVAVAENQGAEAAWRHYPGIHIIASVNGNWTPSVTKSVLLQVLATHPQKIDAVWTTGSELLQVAQAFEQAGRPVPLMTGSPKGDSLAYLHQHPNVRYYGGAVLPSWTAETAFRVAIRLLEGQHPKLDTLMVPIPVATSAHLSQWWRPCMTLNAVSVFPVAPKDPLPESLLNKYFTNGKPTPPYKYSIVAKACS